MAKPITISAFAGMNNVDRVSPVRAIHNMKVTTDKRLVKREGYALWKRLPGVHSLFYNEGEDAFLCAAAGSSSPESLYRVSLNGEIEEVCSIVGLGQQLYYVPLQGRVYVSSSMWNGVYEDGVVRPWGESYGDDAAIMEDASSSEESLLVGVTAAPCMEYLCLGGGRIIGSIGNRIYYNDPPLAYEMFRADAFHEVEGDVVMIATEGKGGLYAKEGFYIATTTATWFAAGYNPEEWDFTHVGNGAVPGSLQYLPTLNKYSNVAVWIDRNGVVAGVGGALQQLTKKKIEFNATGKAASFYRDQEGGQYVTTFPDVGFGDTVTVEVAKRGRAVLPGVVLRPEVAVPSLEGSVKTGRFTIPSLTLIPTVAAPASLHGALVGSAQIPAVTLRPQVSVPSLAGVQSGAATLPSVTLAPQVAAPSLTGVLVVPRQYFIPGAGYLNSTGLKRQFMVPGGGYLNA